MKRSDLCSLEVCFSPAMFRDYDVQDKEIVLVDILRATSTICTALHLGVKSIIPVATIEEARYYKEQGYLVAGERDGKVLDFADFGNSPTNFMNEAVKGKDIAYSTTNGTRAIAEAGEGAGLVVGSYLNISVLTDYLMRLEKDVIIYCSGWKNKFNLEDSLFAGALSERLLASGQFTTICDSCLAALDLWKIASVDLLAYIEKAAHRSRLRKMGLDDILEYCHSMDLAPVIPVLKNKSILRYENK